MAKITKNTRILSKLLAVSLVLTLASYLTGGGGGNSFGESPQCVQAGEPLYPATNTVPFILYIFLSLLFTLILDMYFGFLLTAYFFIELSIKSVRFFYLLLFFNI